MKTIKFGNVLDVTHGIIVHGCNAQKVWGSGIALQIKQKFPSAFKSYIAHLEALTPEEAMGTVDFTFVSDSLIIASAITQLNFGRDPSKRYVSYSALQKAFKKIAEIHSVEIHYPQIGAGLGNGDWSIISDIIDITLQDKNHTLWIYEK